MAANSAATIQAAAQLVALGVELSSFIIDGVNVEMALSGSGAAPTADQQAEIDAGLEAAHAALQAAKPGA